MANEIVGKAIQLVEIDLDVYRATQFEGVIPYEAPAKWTSRWDADTQLVGTIDSRLPSGKGIEFQITGTDALHFWSWDLLPNIRDVSVITCLIPRSSNTDAGVIARGSGSAGSEVGYQCGIKDGTTLQIVKHTGSGNSVLTSMTFNYEDDDLVWIRFDAINSVSLGGASGVTLRAKVWTGSIEDEPDNFMLSANDTSNEIDEAGWAGLMNFDAAGAPHFGFFRARSYLSSSEETYKFAISSNYVPTEFDAIPSIQTISQTPASLSLGENLGTRAQVSIEFMDHPHAEHGEFYNNGTFWGRFRNREIFRRGQPLRVLTGLLGQDINEYEVRHYYLDQFDGPTSDDTFVILAQDLLKFADNDRAQAPRANSGFIVGSLAADGTSFTIGPTGIGDIEYATSGYVAIGGEEIVAFTRSGDTFTITGGVAGRGQFGTEAIEHSGEDRVQMCLQYNAQTPAAILKDLFVNYAAIPEDVIPIEDWESECETYLNRLYGRLIAEPTGVNTLASELITQAGLIVWWDNIQQLLRLQVLRGIVTDTFEYNEDNVIAESIQVEEQRDALITEVWTYYGVRNPLESLNEANNFRSSVVNTHGEASTLNGSAVIKKIFGTWIPAFGSLTAQRTNDLLLGRFVRPPRKVSFQVPRHSGIIKPVEAGGYSFKYRGSQNELGQEITIPIQIVRVEPFPDYLQVEAEEMLFEQFDPGDLTNRVITVDSDYLNFNLRTVHDSIYPPITDEDVASSPTISLTCIISRNVIVGSASVSQAAFDPGSWPSGFVPKIIVRGRIQGHGGKGGILSGGQAGGTALRVRHTIILEDKDGEIWGGGGGGGATVYENSAISGGSGAGQLPGETVSSFSEPATTERGGANPWSGDGGDPGKSGGMQMGTVGAFTGGAAGRAIDGLSFITQSGPTGDRRGPQV